MRVLAAAVVLVLAGCSSGPDVTESKTGDVAKKVEQVSTSDLDAYFEGFASGDPLKMAEAQKMATPDSIAEAYLIHQEAVANAALDGGLGTGKNTVAKSNGGYKLCEEVDGKNDCNTYADFKSAGGKLSSFTIDGRELKDRLAIGTGDPIKVGDFGTARFISSYQSAANFLFVVFEVKSAEQKVRLGLYEATYRAPNGRQSTATYAEGPTELGSDSLATVSIAFEKATPGGEVTWTVSDLDYMSEKTITVKTQ